MDEKSDDALRSLIAHSEAQQFVINFLLIEWFIQIGASTRDRLAEKMLEVAARTEQFAGTARDEFHAERIADTVIQTQEAIRDMVNRALAAARLTERTGSQWPPTAD